jgi:hypothetical protein
VLICSDSQWALNALKEICHSAHFILAPLGARLRGLKGCVCFQWVPAHWGLLGNERAEEEARKAANLGPADGAQRGVGLCLYLLEVAAAQMTPQQGSSQMR